MAKAARFELHMGTQYFLELTHILQLTTRMSLKPEDENLINISVHPNIKLAEATGKGMFDVYVMYPESTNRRVECFPMQDLITRGEDRIVYAYVPVDIGTTFVVFQIETIATF